MAAALHLPLGTAKTRIRGGLQKLRAHLTPIMAALIVGLIALGALLGIRYHSEQAARQLDERALALLTSSDTVTLRLAPAPGVPAAAHGDYRSRPRAMMAVINLCQVPPLPAGQTYPVWARQNGEWTSLGTVRPDAQGSARFIVEGRTLAALPEALQVTVEPAAGSSAPRGPVIVAWPAR